MSQEFTSAELPCTADGTCWPSETMAKPLHIQRVEEALKLDAVLAHVESLNKSSIHRLSNCQCYENSALKLQSLISLHPVLVVTIIWYCTFYSIYD